MMIEIYYYRVKILIFNDRPGLCDICEVFALIQPLIFKSLSPANRSRPPFT